MEVIQRLDIYSPDAEEAFLAIVSDEGKYGVIDQDDNVLVDFEYDSISPVGPGIMQGIQGGFIGIMALGMEGIMCTECIYDRLTYHENYIILHRGEKAYLYMSNLGELTEELDEVFAIDEIFVEVYTGDERLVLDTRDGAAVSDGLDFQVEKIFESERGVVVFERGDETSRLVFVDDFSGEIFEENVLDLLQVIYGPGIDPVAVAFVCDTEEGMGIIDTEGHVLGTPEATDVEVEIAISSGDEENMKVAGVSHHHFKLGMTDDCNCL